MSKAITFTLSRVEASVLLDMIGAHTDRDLSNDYGMLAAAYLHKRLQDAVAEAGEPQVDPSLTIGVRGRAAVYTVILRRDGRHTCTCSDFVYRRAKAGQTCKHIDRELVDNPEYDR
jgi:hypothetical protein